MLADKVSFWGIGEHPSRGLDPAVGAGHKRAPGLKEDSLKGIAAPENDGSCACDEARLRRLAGDLQVLAVPMLVIPSPQLSTGPGEIRVWDFRALAYLDDMHGKQKLKVSTRLPGTRLEAKTRESASRFLERGRSR
jgi:hypothetical protein